MTGASTVNSMRGSSRLRWLPLAVLALLASLDCVLQYSLAATPAFSATHLPDKLLHFLTVSSWGTAKERWTTVYMACAANDTALQPGHTLSCSKCVLLAAASVTELSEAGWCLLPGASLGGSPT